MKVAFEVAEQEFERFAEAMDLDFDTSNMSEEDEKSFNDQKAKVVKAVCEGHLVFNENGEPVYTPKSGADAITFYEPTGASLMAMDQRKKGQDVGKMYAMMGEMCKVHPKTFSKMRQRDLKVCLALATLFLG